MSEKSAYSSEPQRIVVPRRILLLGGGSLLAAAAIDAALPRTAHAQSLISPAPSGAGSVGSEKQPGSGRNDLGLGSTERFLQPEKEVLIKAAIDQKAGIARNFLFTPDGETPPKIAVDYVEANSSTTEVSASAFERVVGQYPKKKVTVQNPSIKVKISPEDTKPLPLIVLETDEKLALLIKDNNQSQDLVTRFNLAYWKYMDLNLTAFSNGRLSEERLEDQRAALSDVDYFFNFSGYTDGVPRENLLEKRKDLATTFMAHTFAIWMSESDQLSQMLNDVSLNSPDFAAPLSSVFLFGLRQLESCANNPEAFNKLGIKKRTIKNIANLSNDEELKSHFKDKGI